MPTNIEWTDETWNPVTGCQKVSPGCKNCYMYQQYPRLKGFGLDAYQKSANEITLVEDALTKPLRWKKPRRIFVCSMSDLFQEGVTFEYIDRVFAVMALCPQHTFQVLTKRPERMAEWFVGAHRRVEHIVNRFRNRDHAVEFPWPLPNVWLGTSVENADYTWRFDELAKCPAVVRFGSLEPLLAPLDVRPWLRWENLDAIPVEMRGRMGKLALSNGLNWAIYGGESGPNARPMQSAWARDLRDQFIAAAVAQFFKQWGEWLPEDHCTDEQWSKARERYGEEDSDGWHRWAWVGKKAAGAMLDGQTFREMPKPVLGVRG